MGQRRAMPAIVVATVAILLAFSAGRYSREYRGRVGGTGSRFFRRERQLSAHAALPRAVGGRRAGGQFLGTERTAHHRGRLVVGQNRSIGHATSEYELGLYSGAEQRTARRYVA